MEYINAEEFQKQPKEIQQVFVDWWKPQIGDLYQYAYIDEDAHDGIKAFCCSSEHLTELTEKYKGIEEGQRIPLLTEGQMRKILIEESHTIVALTSYCDINGYSITLYEEEGIRQRSFKKLGLNLLQAYWKVACEMAKSLSKKEVIE